MGLWKYINSDAVRFQVYESFIVQFAKRRAICLYS